MGDTWDVTCPWCFEQLEVWIDPTQQGSMVQDCEVCCRPWLLHIERDEDGALLSVSADRS